MAISPWDTLKAEARLTKIVKAIVPHKINISNTHILIPNRVYLSAELTCTTPKRRIPIYLMDQEINNIHILMREGILIKHLHDRECTEKLCTTGKSGK